MLDKLRNLMGGKSFPPGFTDGHSIQGRKPSQEDAWYMSPVTMNGQLLLVADGVGGHAHGEYASNLCVEMFRESFESPDTFISHPEAYLRQLIMQIAARVHHKSSTDPTYRGTGSTLSGCYVWGNQFVCFQIGDSRVYRYSGAGELVQLTRDQSLVQDLLDKGAITPEEARIHPQRNMMNSAIGQALDEISIVIHSVEELPKGDSLLLITDGVNDALTDEAIQQILIQDGHEAGVCQKLAQAAYDAGGLDNITALFLRK